MFVVFAYDIVDDRRRTKLAKFLDGFGDRVQYSVFEADIDSKTLEYIKRKIKWLIDDEEDSVRIYSLCNLCRHKVDIIGIGEIFDVNFVYIV